MSAIRTSPESPLLSANELRRNLHRSSPQKKIDPSKSRSVQRLVRTVRHFLTAERLGVEDADEGDIPLQDSYGAISAAVELVSFQSARRAHQRYCSTNGQSGTHIDMCKWYALHYDINAAQEKLVVVYSSPWNLLGFGIHSLHGIHSLVRWNSFIG